MQASWCVTKHLSQSLHVHAWGLIALPEHADAVRELRFLTHTPALIDELQLVARITAPSVYLLYSFVVYLRTQRFTIYWLTKYEAESLSS